MEADVQIADKAFDAGKTTVIPAKSNRKRPRTFDRDLYKARHLIENFFARLKQFRAIATRYDKTARNFLLPSNSPPASSGSIDDEAFIDRPHNGPGRITYDWRHYPTVIQRKPEALRNGAPFLELPDAFKRLQQHLLRAPWGRPGDGGNPALVLHHDEQEVQVAVELALEDGVPTKTHILNRLRRLVDGKTTPPVITAPQALTLANEPKAVVERYDTLRQVREVRLRHDPAVGALVIMLRSLKMRGMAQAGIAKLTARGTN